MRVLMLSWEYPPKVFGGLGRHVHALSEALVAAGHSVTVVTQLGVGPAGSSALLDELVHGVRVVRVPDDPPLVPFTELLAWTMAFNHALARTALLVAGESDKPFDVVHAHDWLVTHAARTVKDVLGLPLVATVHATEAGRHQGWLPGELSKAIHSVEWWLTWEARRVITCSSHMRWEVTRLFDLPPASVDVVPNGIDLDHFSPTAAAVAAMRARFAPDGPLVVLAARLEYEKGVQTALRALPQLRRRHPGLRMVVAGTGTFADELRRQARALRLGRAVEFPGFLDSTDLAALAGAADVAVVPSIYEPFGMVALEAAAAGTPLVVADTGGLREFVEHGLTGLRFDAGDHAGLADGVSALLHDQLLSRRLVRSAREVLARHYAWDTIARRTVEVYQRAQREERVLQAGLAARPTGRPSLMVREGNLLADGQG